MQLGILGFLLGVPQPASSQGQGNDSGDGGDAFASLLSDAGAGNTGGQSSAAALDWGNGKAGAPLTAQEVPAAQGEEAQALVDLLNQQVTPDNADQFLQQLAALTQQTSDPKTQALLSQLTDGVNQVKATNQPMKLGDLLAQLPAIQQAQGEAAKGAQAQTALGLLKQVMASLKQDQTQTAQVQQPSNTATDTADATTQSLQASMFRSDDDSATPEEKKKTQDGARDYVEIVPLSAEFSATPNWVKQIAPVPSDSAASQQEVDAAIPPLTSGLAGKTDDLPQVDLPAMDAADDSAAPKDFSKLLASATADTDSNAAKLTATDNSSLASSLVQNSNAAAHQVTSNAASSNITTATAVINHAPVEQVQLAVTRGVQDGIQHMTIQLEPADLGRVEVHLHTQHDGQTHVSFVVDKPQTLDSLARGAQSLERSLQDAGVKADAGNMQFNLRQQPQAAMQDSGQFGQGSGRPKWSNDEDEKDQSGVAPQAAITATQNYTLTLRDGVDIRA